jgi:hypothetical protein
MIVFSIPVHEKVDVVIDQVRNFRYFVPGSLIVLHVARQWLVADPAVIGRLQSEAGVVVNTESLWTGYGDGSVLSAHVSNFRFALKQGIKFDYFCLHASNDMFVQHGLRDYVSLHDVGSFRFPIDGAMAVWTHRLSAESDAVLRRLRRRIRDSGPVLSSQVEGSFYRTEIFARFSEVLDEISGSPKLFPFGLPPSVRRPVERFFSFLSRFSLLKEFSLGRFYPKEEVYPPTLMARSAVRPGSPYCFINWERNLEITVEDVVAIRSGTFHHDRYGDVFAVKRIERILDDPVRSFIRGLS